MLSSTSKGEPDVFCNPAQPFKIVHTAPEVDGEPEPKKLCVYSPPPPESTEKALFGCNKTDEAKAHSQTYPLDPDNEYDSDDSDDIDPSIVEFNGEKEGYFFNCLLGCGGDPCSFDHGNGKTKGIYVPKLCSTCYQFGHWTKECSIPPTFEEEDEL